MIRRVKLPYSEVCMHMRVAGKTMLVQDVGHNMAQLYEMTWVGADNNARPQRPGGKFSFPILHGEAGLGHSLCELDDAVLDQERAIADLAFAGLRP